ncbi:MAG: hypothetical protein Q8K61_08620 [Gallionella sp.]|nr:hypothetical protein [Gallionella sp.]
MEAGISSPYEAPEAAELSVNTGAADLDLCIFQILDLLLQHGVAG